MTTHLKKTVKHSAIYAFGTILRRITGLVMLPIYTRYLTPADYGVIELILMAIELVTILIGLRISQAMFRYYILAEGSQEKRIIVSTVLLTVVGTSIVGATVLCLIAEPLALLLLGSTKYVYEFQLFAFTLVANAIAAVGLSYLRARQMPVLFVIIGAITLALQVTLNIIFVVMLEMHVTGVAYSALISGIVLAMGLALYMVVNVGLHYSVEVAGKLVKFVSPLVIASLGAFYVAYADKYLLRIFGGLTEVGLYALAARLSSVLSTAFEAFNMSWEADRFKIVKKDNAKEIYEQVFRFMSAAIIIVGAGMALFANDFFHVMTNPEFYPAGYIVPILILAVIFRIYTVFCNFGSLYGDQTRIIAEASWIKVIVASVGYVLLIPIFGVYGAAIVLAISNLVELLYASTRSTRVYDMGLNWEPIIMMLSVAVVLVSIGLLIPEKGVTYFGARLLLFSSLILSIYFLPIWKNNEKDMARALLSKLIGKCRITPR
jgi:O-antigen/teichoic acid export membrane protein